MSDPRAQDSPSPASQGDQAFAGDNPLAHQFDFKLLMPAIQVKMVNADRFGDYEIWLFAAATCISAAVGFFVAFAQGSPSADGSVQHDHTMVAGAVISFVLFLVFFGRAMWIRRLLSREARTYPMRAQQVSQRQEPL